MTKRVPITGGGPLRRARQAVRARRSVSEESVRGLPLKLGQLLSFDEVPVEPAAPPLDEADVRTLLEQRLGAPFDTLFTALNTPGLVTSLGQVHRATLRDGRIVAVKLQRPELEAALRIDLQTLSTEHRAEVQQHVEHELDYRREAEALTTFSSAAQRLGVVVPRVMPELVRRDVLVMDWCEGASLTDARSWAADERAELGKTLARFLFNSVFELGRVHADPHPGNFLFRREVRPLVTVLDFGTVLTLESRARRALLHLVAAQLGALALTADDAFGLWLELGFNPAALEPLRELLPRLGQLLFRPFSSSGPFETAQWQPGRELDALLGDRLRSLRLAAPPSLLLLVRAVRGLVAWLEALEVQISWRTLVIEALNRATPTPRATPGRRRE